MTSFRVLGPIVAVFLLSMSVGLLMNSASSGWQFLLDTKEVSEEKEERDDPVVDVLCLKAMKEMSDGNYGTAIATYTKAIERDPKYLFSYIGRGDAYILRGDLDQAIHDYTQATRLDPANSAARERLAISQMERAGK
jgi:tetratricopeptide (TPR) repeat protein